MRKSVYAILLCAAAAARADSPAPGDGRFGGDPDRPRYAPSKPYDLTHVHITLDVDVKKQRIKGKVEHTVTVTAPTTTELPLMSRGLTITGATLDGGGKLSWGTTDSGIALTLPRAYKRGESLTVAVSYEGSPQLGLYFRHPDDAYPNRPWQAWTQGESDDNCGWVPIWDYPNDRATSELTLTLPADLTVIANGKLLDTREDKAAKTKTWHWKESVPHVTYLISFIAGDFAKIEETAKGAGPNKGDVPVEHYVPRGLEAVAKKNFANTTRILQTYAEVLATPYPYEKFAQTVIDGFMWGGMENVSAVTLDDRALAEGYEESTYSPESLIAHEAAHQWFGDLVTCEHWGEAWLNEGFATFMEGIWHERAHGEGVADAWRIQAMDGYAGEVAADYARPMVTNIYTEPSAMFDSHTYSHGALVLHMLRRMLGDDVFWQGMHEYLDRHARDLVDTADFADAMSDAAGQPLDWFFEQWAYRSGYPKLEASWSWDAKAKLVRIDVKQAQERDGNDTPIYRLPTVVEVWTAAPPSGKRERHEVTLSRAEEAIYVPSSSRPKLVLLDPEHDLIRSLRWNRSIAEAILAMSHPRAAARIEAAALLGQVSESSDAVEALVKCANQDKVLWARTACLQALGTSQGPGAVVALTKVLAGDKSPEARLAAAQALGATAARRDPSAADALIKALSADKAPRVRRAAAEALGRTRSPKAYEALAAALKVDSYRDQVRIGALEGFGSLRDTKALPTVLAFTKRGVEPDAREAAIAAAVTLSTLLPEPDDDTREAALAMIADPADYRIQMMAIEALGGSDDAKVLETLDRASRAQSDRLRSTAITAAADLRATLRQASKGGAVEEKVDDLAEEARELRRRLDAVEGRMKGK
jgi:aminopeptidase N